MLANLLTVGACFALGAFIFSLKLGNRRRSISALALFVAMLSLMLYALYPQFEGVLGTVAILAAGVYAFVALQTRNAARRDSEKK